MQQRVLLAFAPAALLWLASCGDSGTPAKDTTLRKDLMVSSEPLSFRDQAAELPKQPDGSKGDKPQKLDQGPPSDRLPDYPKPIDAATCANTSASCGAPGHCVSCVGDPAGSACVSGACGCSVAATDCPSGQACDTTKHACTNTCGSAQACNGGCCSAASGGTCQPGNTQAVCAISGQAVCASCVGNASGSACLTSGACGCNGPADCPVGNACDTTTHKCTTACSSTQACHSGCCSAASGGTCQAGTAATACGNSGGLCVSCSAQFAAGKAGNICKATTGGGQCGCDTLTNCPASATACSANVCQFTCSATVACLTGCCSSATTGTCQAGTANNACGLVGVCTNCTTSVVGHVCEINGQCGCNSTTDCPANYACNLTNHICTKSCNGSLQPCNGGCCSGGTCVAGTQGAACGKTGGTCTNCTYNLVGHACVSGACGCTQSSECSTVPPFSSCSSTTSKCQSSCSSTQPCNGNYCLSSVCSASFLWTDTTWKRTLTPGAGWTALSYNDAAWPAATDEGARGVAPWYYNTAGWPSFSQAHWIWYWYSNNGGDTSTVYFRKSFYAPKSSMTLYMTADNSFTAYLNGTLVCTGNNWQTTYVCPLTVLTPSSLYVIAVQTGNSGGPGGLLGDLR